MKIRTWTTALLGVYAALVTYTTVSAMLGIRYQPFFTPLLSLLAFIFALLHGSQRMGWRKTLLLLGLTFGVSLLFESVGVATGWVYGPYHYSDILGPKFLGLVPYLIPVAWFMMTYPSYVIATRLAPAIKSRWGWRLWVAAVGALVMTAWDLAMDPMMSAGGHWVWEVEGAYFGIPLQNYWGWWLTVFVTFILFLVIGRVTNEFVTTNGEPGSNRQVTNEFVTTNGRPGSNGQVTNEFVTTNGEPGSNRQVTNEFVTTNGRPGSNGQVTNEFVTTNGEPGSNGQVTNEFVTTNGEHRSNGQLTNEFVTTNGKYRSNDFSRYDRLAILSYTFTAMSSIAIDFRYGMGGPAMVGLFAMLPWVLLGWQKNKA